MLANMPDEMNLIYLLFENPKKALLGFSEEWASQQMGISEEQAINLIKNLRNLNIIKLGPTGLNFIINTSL